MMNAPPTVFPAELMEAGKGGEGGGFHITNAEFVAAVRNMDNALDVLRRVCAWIAIRMVTRPGLYSLISLLVVGGLSGRGAGHRRGAWGSC